MPETTGSSRRDEMAADLQRWQSVERLSMDSSARIMEETKSPLIRLVMEIIRHDSLMHHRVQQFLIDSLKVQDVAVTRDDVVTIWERIEEHDIQEREAIELAADLRDRAWSPVHKQLLDYLIADEEKHERLLGILEEIKAGMILASGA